MPRYAFVIVIGALVAYYQSQLPDPYWALLVPGLLLLAWRQPRCRSVALLVAAYLYCSGLLQFHLDHRITPDMDGARSLVEGVIADVVEVKPGRIRFEFEPHVVENYSTRMPRRLRLNWYRSEVRPRAGEIWRLKIKLKRPSGYLNPGGFDYEGWLFSRGIDGLGYVDSHQVCMNDIFPEMVVLQLFDENFLRFFT